MRRTETLSHGWLLVWLERKRLFLHLLKTPSPVFSISPPMEVWSQQAHGYCRAHWWWPASAGSTCAQGRLASTHTTHLPWSHHAYASHRDCHLEHLFPLGSAFCPIKALQVVGRFKPQMDGELKPGLLVPCLNKV